MPHLPARSASDRWTTITLQTPALAEGERAAVALTAGLPRDSSRIAVIIDADASTAFSPEFTYALFRELFRRRSVPSATILRPPLPAAQHLAAAALEFGVSGRLAVLAR